MNINLKENKVLGKAVAAVLWWKNPLSHEDELLMTKRRSDMRVFPGYTAFPGGKVDPQETELMALIREIKEEVAIEINTSSRARYLGKATTPASHPYRFETNYFGVELTKEEKVQIEKNLKGWKQHPEFSDWSFETATSHLSRFSQGNVLMVPLVRLYLEEVKSLGIASALMKDFDEKLHAKYYYPLEMQEGILQLFIPSKTLPPHSATNCFLINARTHLLRKVRQSVLLVDPSPKDEDEWQRMIHVLEDLKIDVKKILCTHHHIDHCSFLDKTAKHFAVPVMMHEKTYFLGSQKDDVAWEEVLSYVQFVEDGDYLDEIWKGKKIRVDHVPGHAEGQIALTNDDGDFYIAGDLFQSQGSVVIGGRGSSMKAYMESLVKVIKQNPKVLYPSHGIPLGSLDPLKKLIRHRLERHEQLLKVIKDLETQNASFDSVVLTKKIYVDLDVNLFNLAKATVESHLTWMKEQRFAEIQNTFLPYC